MPPKIKKNEIKIVGEIRRSQLITTYGSGAIVDFPRLSGIMAGIDNWKIRSLPEEAKIHERNLEKMLGKDCFYQVSSLETESGLTFSLPVYRFPGWYYCPECHRLDHYTKIAKSTANNTTKFNSALECNNCSRGKYTVKLVPSRFVAACLNGHIEDFPYMRWVHKENGLCEKPSLKLEYKSASGGLGDIIIECENCKQKSSMAGCMNKEALKGLNCGGNMPWLGFDVETHKLYRDPNKCHAGLRVLQRSANNVYYPINSSALTIPPWSEKLQAVFKSRNSMFEDIFDEEDEEEIRRSLIKQFKKHPDLYGNNEEAFISSAFKTYRDDTEIVDEKSLRCDEYIAFCNEDTDDEFFKTSSVEIPDEFSELIAQIKQVKKLREVMVLRGFRRILPVAETDAQKRIELGLSNAEFSPISRQPLNWLPAIELFGEGIFIELNNNAVLQWEEENIARYQELAKRHSKNYSWVGHGMYDIKHPRYVLLHTLAHLLIRQLSAQCGYSTASLKEKIYSSFPEKDTEMCGILIYTSATDTDGSLGGLVRAGAKKNIFDTIKSMLEESSWCSNDPLCIESHSQGYHGLNYSACHACTLLPETCCESLNCLLDRAVIVGTPDNPDIGFFKKFL